ncbi:MAG: hypothetical protein RLZZ319_850 [Actinomycetota bacterium]|jgi:uncharacterized protein with FMN-binding domain
MRPTSAFVSGMATMGVLAGGVFIGTGVLNNTSADATASGGSGGSTTTNSGSGNNGGNSGSSGNSSSSGSGSGTSTGKDGTFTGDVVQTRYGPMEVQITIKAGKITDAQALQHPGGDPTSTQINSQVIPILTKATLDYQTVTFGNVSRATISTNAYKQSAQSALDKAGYTG